MHTFAYYLSILYHLQNRQIDILKRTLYLDYEVHVWTSVPFEYGQSIATLLVLRRLTLQGIPFFRYEIPVCNHTRTFVRYTIVHVCNRRPTHFCGYLIEPVSRFLS